MSTTKKEKVPQLVFYQWNFYVASILLFWVQYSILYHLFTHYWAKSAVFLEYQLWLFPKIFGTAAHAKPLICDFFPVNSLPALFHTHFW